MGVVSDNSLGVSRVAPCVTSSSMIEKLPSRVAMCSTVSLSPRKLRCVAFGEAWLVCSNRIIFHGRSCLRFSSFHKTLSATSTYSQKPHASQQELHVPMWVCGGGGWMGDRQRMLQAIRFEHLFQYIIHGGVDTPRYRLLFLWVNVTWIESFSP